MANHSLKPSSFNGDILRPLNYVELDLLLQIYQRNRPQSDAAYLFLLQQRRFFHLLNDETRCRSFPERLRFAMYTPSTGHLERNGTLISFSVGTKCLLFTFTLEESGEELRQSLTQSELICWQNAVSVFALPDILMPVIEEKLYSIDAQYTQELCTYPSTILKVSAERALNYEYDIPAGFALRSLDADAHAAAINAVWPYRDSDSESFVHGMVKFYGGLGLFATDGSLQPVSWVIMNEFQGMGLLQTAETERGKGYAKVVVKAFCKSAAAKHGADIVAFVVDTNRASYQLMLGLGFSVAGHCVYLDYKCE